MLAYVYEAQTRSRKGYEKQKIMLLFKGPEIMLLLLLLLLLLLFLYNQKTLYYIDTPYFKIL